MFFLITFAFVSGVLAGYLLKSILESYGGEWEEVSKFQGDLTHNRGSDEVIFKLEQHSKTNEERAYAELIDGGTVSIPVDLFKAKVDEFKIQKQNTL